MAISWGQAGSTSCGISVQRQDAVDKGAVHNYDAALRVELWLWQIGELGVGRRYKGALDIGGGVDNAYFQGYVKGPAY